MYKVSAAAMPEKGDPLCVTAKRGGPATDGHVLFTLAF